MAHIIAVDDAPDICAVLKAALEKDGHTVQTLYTAAELTEKVCEKADLILLDVMLPGENGFDACKRIRALVSCPIVFITAKADEADVVKGLMLGGDDYITKPFKLAEVRARVTAHLRGAHRTASKRFVCGALSFDMQGRVLYFADEAVPLTKGEYDICETLAAHPGLVYTREQLIEAVFGYDSESDEAAITEHIKNIRAKLAAKGLAPIETVWGMGYKWKNENP